MWRPSDRDGPVLAEHDPRRERVGQDLQVVRAPRGAALQRGQQEIDGGIGAAAIVMDLHVAPADAREVVRVVVEIVAERGPEFLALARGYTQVTSAAAQLVDRVAVARTAEELGRILQQAHARVDYTVERESKAVGSAWPLEKGLADLVAFGAQQKTRLEALIRERADDLGLGVIRPVTPPPNVEAQRIVVRRKRMGTITLDDLSRDLREGFPAASFWGAPVSALYWCDGKRTLAEVIRLAELEMGPQTIDFVAYFKFLEKHGYVEFVR
jgi:hypothetical protein